MFAGVFPVAIIPPQRCKRCWETGCDDFTGPHCARCFAELVDDVELTCIALESITIDIPAEQYFVDLTCALFKKLKAKPVPFRFVFQPFTLDAMKSLRRYMLLQHDVTLPLPKQTKGSRGGVSKEWVMRVDDTDSFEKIVGAEWPESSVSRGTGRMFSWDSFTGWIPPLQFTVRATDQSGTRSSSCIITAASSRITEHGFNHSRRLSDPAELTAQRYLSRHVFLIQNHRVQENHLLTLGGGVGGDLLPHALLLRAAPHAGAQ